MSRCTTWCHFRQDLRGGARRGGGGGSVVVVVGMSIIRFSIRVQVPHEKFPLEGQQGGASFACSQLKGCRNGSWCERSGAKFGWLGSGSCECVWLDMQPSFFLISRGIITTTTTAIRAWLLQEPGANGLRRAHVVSDAYSSCTASSNSDHLRQPESDLTSRLTSHARTSKPLGHVGHAPAWFLDDGLQVWNFLDSAARGDGRPASRPWC